MCSVGKCNFELPETFYNTDHGWTLVDESRDDYFRMDALYNLLIRHIPSSSACLEECMHELGTYGFEEDRDGFSPLDDYGHWFWEDPELPQFAIDEMIKIIDRHVPDGCGYFGLHWNGGCIGFWPPEEKE